MKLKISIPVLFLSFTLVLFSGKSNDLATKLIDSLHLEVIVLSKKNTPYTVQQCSYCEQKNCYKLSCPGTTSSFVLCLSCIEETQKKEIKCINCLQKRCPFNECISGENKIAIDRRHQGVEALSNTNHESFDSFFYYSLVESFFLIPSNHKIEIIILKSDLSIEEIRALNDFGFKQNAEKQGIWKRSLTKQ
jgi:hypothetical protein